MKKNKRNVTINKMKETMDKDVKSDKDVKLDIKYYTVNCYQGIVMLMNYVNKIIKIGLGVIGIYLLWILLHYAASHLYVKWCVPNTMYGFLLSPFLVATPYCTGLRWLMYTGANTIHNMWILFGSWISTRMAIFMNV